MIPITRLSVGEEEAAAAAEAVRSGWITAGKRGQQFESLVAEYVGAAHAIATNSCTTALHLALIAAGIRAGDEVIVPSFSFIASANAILYVGATPVFADIDPRTYNVDPARVEEAVTPRTKAILPASQIGLGADLPALLAIARRHGLRVIEDAAPSLGATVHGQRVGSISDFTCFSFDTRKILTVGEGGMITTNDEAAAARLRSLRAHAASVSAMTRHSATTVAFEEYPELGYNYKLTDIQAAIGVVQMGKVESFVAERRRLAARYQELLGNDERIVLPCEPAGYRHVFQSYCVRLRTKPQAAVMADMNGRGVATRRIMASHLEPLYRRQYPTLSLPESERASRETMLLPMFVGLSDTDQDEVAEALRKALD
jgi:dTDP-4-amino-4,6-dideoxygalactose transaminase